MCTLEVHFKSAHVHFKGAHVQFQSAHVHFLCSKSISYAGRVVLKHTYSQYVNCKILHGGTLLQP